MPRISIWLTASMVLAITGCSTFSDVNYEQKAKTELAQLANSQLVTIEQNFALAELLSSPELDALVKQAIEHNPSLMQTLLTLKVSQQKYNQVSASQWPSLSANINANRKQDTANNYTASLDLSWTLDVWQQLDNASSAQLASALASEFNYQAAKDLLAANVMQTYLQLIQYAQLISIQKQNVETLATNEQIIVSRYRKGLIDLKDLDTAKANTQSAQSTLVDYEYQYQQVTANLALLTGTTEVDLAYLTVFPEVNKAISQLDTVQLGRRPDLQQAYQTIVANQYQHKVAYKALLPEFSLTASLANTDQNFHQALFGSSAWQLLGRLTAPLFNAGKLKSDAEIAKLNAEQSYWSFREKLLNAVNEVELAWQQEQTLSNRIELTKSAYDSAKRSEVTYTERYRQGTVSLLDLLQIQQSTFSLQSQLSQLNYQRLSNRIQLGLALGYGV